MHSTALPGDRTPPGRRRRANPDRRRRCIQPRIEPLRSRHDRLCPPDRPPPPAGCWPPPLVLGIGRRRRAFAPARTPPVPSMLAAGARRAGRDPDRRQRAAAAPKAPPRRPTAAGRARAAEGQGAPEVRRDGRRRRSTTRPAACASIGGDGSTRVRFVRASSSSRRRGSRGWCSRSSLLVFLTPVLIIALILWYQMRKTRMLNETMLKLAEKGVVPPAEAYRRARGRHGGDAVRRRAGAALRAGEAGAPQGASWSDLRKGVIMAASASGFTFYSMLDDGTPNVVGLVLLFVGLGFVVLWCFEERQRRRRAMRAGPAAAAGPPPRLTSAAHRTPRRDRPDGAAGHRCRAHRPCRRPRRPPRLLGARAPPPVRGARALRRLTAGNHALADDLAQETFVLAWRNLNSFRQEAQFSTWLYRIATNCWLADARKRKEELLGDRDARSSPTTTTAIDRTPGRAAATTRAAPRSRSTWSARMARALRRRAGRDRPVLP